MSNYDDLLRKKEQESHLDDSNKELHWKVMAGLLDSSPASTQSNYGGGKIINIFKIVLIVVGVSALSYWAYQQLTKEKKKFNGILKPSNIPSQYFTIDASTDTVLRTSHASILKIKKGTFITDKPVTIEVKEVFTPAEILQSGLTTLSDSRPLRSAGMLYFNASVEGKSIDPLKPVQTFIPAKEKDADMQLFKGEVQSDSTVNWTAPKEIVDTSRPADFESKLAAGRAFFMAKCASCHNIFKDGTGPSLRGFQNRGPWKDPRNILRFIKNPSAYISTDAYTQNLLTEYKSMMTAFPDITQSNVEALLTYLNETKKEEQIKSAPFKKTDTAAGFNYSDDAGINDTEDCGSDTSYYSVQNNFEEYDSSGYIDFDTIPSDMINGQVFDYSEYEGIYRQGYDFQITDNGWYNVDAFLKTENNNVKDVSVSAAIENGESLPYNVYLFVPSERILVSYTSKKGNNYQFSFLDNKVPLPLRYRAVIFAFGSSGKKILYGATEFTIQNDQHIKVELKETTQEGLMNVLYTHNINGVKIEAIEKEMELIPRPCPQKDTGIVNGPDKDPKIK